MKFADAVALKDGAIETEVGDYFVRTWLEELRKIDQNADNEAHRSRMKLEQFCEDEETTPLIMSEYLRRFTVPYGVSRDCSFARS